MSKCTPLTKKTGIGPVRKPTPVWCHPEMKNRESESRLKKAALGLRCPMHPADEQPFEFRMRGSDYGIKLIPQSTFPIPHSTTSHAITTVVAQVAIAVANSNRSATITARCVGLETSELFTATTGRTTC